MLGRKLLAAGDEWRCDVEARPDALDASFRGRDGPTNMASTTYLSRDREMLHVMCDFNIHIYIYSAARDQEMLHVMCDLNIHIYIFSAAFA